MVLNFLYRLKMMSAGRFRVRGLFRKFLELAVKLPDYFSRFSERFINDLLGSASAISALGKDIESKVVTGVLDGVHEVPVPSEEIEGDVLSALTGPEGGLVQRIVRYSSRTENTFTTRALFISMSLQKLQRSLERSLLTSALLSGVATTLALLFLALRSI
ncbi:MAG: hypothetical protein QXZ37_04505 [Sulfolobales archaeon]